MRIHPIKALYALFGAEKKPSNYLKLVDIRLNTPRLIARWRSVYLPFVIGLAIVAGANLFEGLHASTRGLNLTEVITHITSEKFLLTKAIEVGAAFMIASILAFFIEKSAREEQTRLFEEALKVIGNDVVQGVYGIRHDKEYVKAVISSTLAIIHVRKNYNVYCQISEFSEEEKIQHNISEPNLVKITADIRYQVHNISNNKAEFEGKYFIPTRSNGASGPAEMTSLRIGDRVRDKAQIAKLRILENHEDHSATEHGYRFSIPVDAGSYTEVHLKAVFAKERSDNEIFTFLLPTIGAQIRFHFEMSGLRIGVTPRCAGESNREETLIGREIIWSTAAPVLPNNAVTIWWREATPTPTVSAGLAEADHQLTEEPEDFAEREE